MHTQWPKSTPVEVLWRGEYRGALTDITINPQRRYYWLGWGQLSPTPPQNPPASVREVTLGGAHSPWYFWSTLPS